MSYRLGIQFENTIAKERKFLKVWEPVAEASDSIYQLKKLHPIYLIIIGVKAPASVIKEVCDSEGIQYDEIRSAVNGHAIPELDAFLGSIAIEFQQWLQAFTDIHNEIKTSTDRSVRVAS